MGTLLEHQGGLGRRSRRAATGGGAELGPRRRAGKRSLWGVARSFSQLIAGSEKSHTAPLRFVISSLSSRLVPCLYLRVSLPSVDVTEKSWRVQKEKKLNDFPRVQKGKELKRTERKIIDFLRKGHFSLSYESNEQFSNTNSALQSPRFHATFPSPRPCSCALP